MFHEKITLALLIGPDMPIKCNRHFYFVVQGVKTEDQISIRVEFERPTLINLTRYLGGHCLADGRE